MQRQLHAGGRGLFVAPASAITTCLPRSASSAQRSRARPHRGRHLQHGAELLRLAAHVQLQCRRAAKPLGAGRGGGTRWWGCPRSRSQKDKRAENAQGVS